MNLSGTKQAYLQYYKSSHEDGFLDAKTKELIHIAALLATRCET
ncbi:MAG: carboxymuconolactone decarboxylase family protein [Desulfocucumaceae bacterium]